QTGRNGCFSTKVPVASFNLTSLHYENQLYAYASLLEEGTGMSRTAIKSCMIVYEMATITFENTDKFYKPGIPYTGTMLLKGTNGSALKEKEFLLVVNARGETQLKTLLTDASGRASFELDTSRWNDKVSLRGELKDDPPASEHEEKEYLNFKSVTRYLYPFSSDSKSFLKIGRLEKKLLCGQTQQLGVDYLFDKKAMGTELQSLDVVFLVLAKGTIATVLSKEVPAEAGLRGSFSLELPIGPELAPKAKVLGYAVLPDGEMVADSTELKVAKCFPSKVNLSFSEQRALVGSQLQLKVEAAPGSLCAIHIVDQRMWSSGLKVKLNPSMVTLYTRKVSGEKLYQAPCWLQKDGWGHPASFHPFWQHVQVMPLFAGAGLEKDKQAGVMLDTGMQVDFLGTWLWELVPVGEGGSAEVMVTVPDAITVWEAGMFCTSPLGLGLAPAISLTAFKPFFVELALPYAVVRHEAFTLVATVFNCLRQCLRVRVTLAESAELEVLVSTDEVYGGCICADEERTFQWSVRATSLEKVNVTVIAEALRSEKLCGTEMPVVPAQGHMDTETKLLMVQVS
ncbi:A2MG protein, partial [Spizaetus tyrannus]|nr:A2MG protein [Spizaetus tyrannus]